MMGSKKFLSISPIFNEGGIGSGFFSNYRICLEKLMYHHNNKSEGKPYINWANTTFVDGFNPIIENGEVVGGEMVIDDTKNPFDLWFDQENLYEMGIPLDDIIISPIERSMGIIHTKNYFDEPQRLKEQQDIDRLYIKPKQFILDKINEIYDREFNGHIVLGVMARGSEYNFWHGDIYGVFGVEDYIKRINEILIEHPEITKLFIVSDETEYVEELHKAFPSSYFIPNVFRRTDETIEYMNRVPCWMNVSDKRENHCALLGEETIIQTKLLSKCDYLFGRRCGVLSGAVLWNENIKKLITL
jgi:hypothetical protein